MINCEKPQQMFCRRLIVCMSSFLVFCSSFQIMPVAQLMLFHAFLFFVIASSPLPKVTHIVMLYVIVGELWILLVIDIWELPWLGLSSNKYYERLSPSSSCRLSKSEYVKLLEAFWWSFWYFLTILLSNLLVVLLVALLLFLWQSLYLLRVAIVIRGSSLCYFLDRLIFTIGK